MNNFWAYLLEQNEIKQVVITDDNQTKILGYRRRGVYASPLYTKIPGYILPELKIDGVKAELDNKIWKAIRIIKVSEEQIKEYEKQEKLWKINCRSIERQIILAEKENSSQLNELQKQKRKIKRPSLEEHLFGQFHY